MSDRVILPGAWQDIVPRYFGFEDCEKGHSCGPAIRDCYLLHYVFSGQGQFYKAGNSYNVGPGDIFVICPNEVTTYIASTQNPWSYCWAAFAAPQFPFLSEAVIHVPQAQQLFSDLRRAVREQESDMRFLALLYELLWLLQKQDVRSTQRMDYAFYAKMHIDNTYMTKVSVEKIAQSLHIDRRHLSFVFRRAYGCTPQQYLMQLRMEKAKEFLQLGCSVNDAAAMSGFSDLANFSKKFKAYHGSSPRAYKL